MTAPSTVPAADPEAPKASSAKRKPVKRKPVVSAPYAQVFMTADEVARVDRVAGARHLKRISWAKEVCRRALAEGVPYPGDKLGETAPRHPEDGWKRLSWRLGPEEEKLLERSRGKVPSTSYLRALIMRALLSAEAA